MPKVLVVDDSALMRNQLKQILVQAGYQVESATNGKECLQKINTFNPDVITLDINMPVMDGLSCLKQIMQSSPRPVIMISSLTEKGADATIQALELGAFDYLPKASGSYSNNIATTAPMLLEKVKYACASPIRKATTAHSSEHKNQVSSSKKTSGFQNYSNFVTRPSFKVIVVGVSTGGPICLQEILKSLPSDFPVPIVVAQHMPARFTHVFAQRLDKTCKLKVQEVTSSNKLTSGNVYIAQGDSDLVFTQGKNALTVELQVPDSRYPWHPSVTKLVDSALSYLPAKEVIFVQLTGMGNDGSQSMFTAFQRGATTIAESQETAIVYGMPKELINKGGASHVLANHQIAAKLRELVY